MPGRCAIGVAAIALGVGFNIPYAVLAVIFDYPQILREPAITVLEQFARGGPLLVLTWYGFMLAALVLVPLAPGLALTRDRFARHPAMAIAAAIAGSLAGLAQSIGLARWVFVVPNLARDSGSAQAVQAYDLLNAYGGVAVGEHIGQLLTALFAGLVAALQRSEGQTLLSGIGCASALGIALGTGEGLALALSSDGEPFALATITGFLVLSLWLIATGLQLVLRPSEHRAIGA